MVQWREKKTQLFGKKKNDGLKPTQTPLGNDGLTLTQCPQTSDAPSSAYMYTWDNTNISVGGMGKDTSIKSGILQGSMDSTTLFKMINYLTMREERQDLEETGLQ